MALGGEVEDFPDAVVVQDLFDNVSLINIGAVVLHVILLVFCQEAVEIGVSQREIVDVVDKYCPSLVNFEIRLRPIKPRPPVTRICSIMLHHKVDHGLMPMMGLPAQVERQACHYPRLNFWAA